MKDEEKYLEDEMEKFGERWPYPASFDGYDKDWVDELAEECAKHFYEFGKKAMKEQMMEGALEGEVCGRVYDHINVRFADGVCKYLEPKNISHIPADVSKYNIGDKVKIIIVKEDKK